MTNIRGQPVDGGRDAHDRQRQGDAHAPRGADPVRVAAADGVADARGGRHAEAERDHERERHRLDRDLVPRQGGLADDAHQDRRHGEEAGLEADGERDRPPEAGDLADLRASTRAQRTTGWCGSRRATYTARSVAMSVYTMAVAYPVPTRPSAGKPQRPNISALLARTFARCRRS
jgi:hypothetical protein